MRIAVIDLGTNTFNLLLAQTYADKTYRIICTYKLAAKIGEGGINRQIITDEATARAIQVINGFKEKIISHGGADEIIAIATSAVRTAKNKVQFINDVKKSTGIDIKVISGEDEATYIFEGVKQTVEMGLQPMLTLDIGGGSNEFIIANNEKIYWKKSFPLGIARILEMFRPENPIITETLQQVENYFEQQLSPLWAIIEKYPVKTLVGCSGSFETYRTLLTNDMTPNNLSFDIQLTDYLSLHQQLVKSTADERKNMEGMDPMRVEMIVLASIFTHKVIQKSEINHIIQSEYSLKEGVMKLVAEGRFPI